MGRLAAEDMAANASLETALQWHLEANCFPPIPEVYDAALAAIIAVNDGEWDEEIALPEGVTWRGHTTAPAWACVDGWHLEAFTCDR